MQQRTTTPSLPMTVGLDLGDRQSYFALLGDEGVVEEGKVATERGKIRELFERLRELGATRVVCEVGTHSPWVSRELAKVISEVVVADPYAVKLIWAKGRKSDKRDAVVLARLGRSDPELLSPIEHRGEEAQRDLMLLRTRSKLVEMRTVLVNHVRGASKSLGTRLPSCSARSFAKKVREHLPEELRGVLEVALEILEGVNAKIGELDRRVEEMSRERYPETMLLRQVAGVGALTALAFVLTLERPGRIRGTRNVGAYLGLCPGRSQSGKSDPELHITKTGDNALRSLLVNCAHYILGPFGPDSDLRRHGEKIAMRGGKAAKKRAVIAVARKLSVLLLALWRSAEVYDPLRTTRELEATVV